MRLCLTFRKLTINFVWTSHGQHWLFGLGYVSEAIRQFQRAERDGDKEARALALSNIACLAPGDPALDNQAIMEVRMRWAAAQGPVARPKASVPRRCAGDGAASIARKSTASGS